jgi:hypothetical protein
LKESESLARHGIEPMLMMLRLPSPLDHQLALARPAAPETRSKS